MAGSNAHPAEDSIVPPPLERKGPLLASEALREEVAPLEPGRTECRIWFLGVATSLAFLGAALVEGTGTVSSSADSSSVTFASAGAAAAVAVLPFRYGLRAGAAMAIGVALMFLGMQGIGPLAGLAADGGHLRDLARFVAMSVLPAALLFRAHYRAYRPARLVLAGALLVSVPFVVLEIGLVASASVPTLSRIAGCLSIVGVASSLAGFMGADTTGAGSVWAAVVIGVLSMEIGVRELTPLAGPDTGLLAYPVAAIGLLCAALLSSMGLYQLLAALLAGDARSMKHEATD